MKKTFMAILVMGLFSIQAFANQDQCLAIPSYTSGGFYIGYSVHCSDATELSFPARFKSQETTLKNVAKEMRKLGLNKVKEFSSGEVYFLPQADATHDYVLAKNIQNRSYVFDVQDGVKIFASTFSNLNFVAKKFNMSFVWRFRDSGTDTVFVIHKK